MSEELKPCPFCGGDAKYVPADYIDANGDPWPFAECDACHVGSPVEFWNRRAQPAEQDEPVAAAKVGRLFPNGYSLVKQGEQSVSVVWSGISMTFSEREPDGRMGQLIDFLRLMIDTPAAQAVKLPERRNERPLGNWTTAETYREAKGFNDALDAVAKLNGIEP